MFKSLGAAAAALALVAASAPASAQCWNREETSAATIRDLQSLLMVATLRCRAAGMDITADYNGFVSANRQLVQHENDRIKAHFIRAAGPVAGQRAYDSFATHLANIYGGDASTPDACENLATVAREGALMANSEEGLLLLASRQGISTDLPGGMCERPTIAYGEGAPVTARADVPPAYAMPAGYNH
ncbi:hypothetical protein FHS31_000178 [Sphingomonas vulcanisoli]|uniref:S-adenosyl-L-homocysteine hydrolase n=1 Tax=Sphingomonas vulcanisoli TaxID=1658060 RepID=A0ABX0TSK3_9SPHN|nr:hypothetical protein [Sphingomonas vulcanisoli]NIJ06596.1 hypothetical protein [Sphingomonas vulcanisoli]